MTDRDVLIDWVLEALRSRGGKARPLDVAKHIWAAHEQELRRSGDLFFTWQYDMRWAAQKLRNAGRLKAVEGRRDLPWELTEMDQGEE